MAKSSSTSKLHPGQPGYVGRGHPPEHGKIRKGETRNPWGSKGKNGKGGKSLKTNFAVQFAELLAEPVRAKNGQIYSRAEIALNGLMKGVVDGDVRCIKLFFDLQGRYNLPQQADEDEQLGADDQAIIERYEHRILRRAGLDPDATAALNNESELGEGDDAGEADHV